MRRWMASCSWANWSGRQPGREDAVLSCLCLSIPAGERMVMRFVRNASTRFARAPARAAGARFSRVPTVRRIDPPVSGWEVVPCPVCSQHRVQMSTV